MGFESLTVEDRGVVRVVTVNRPAVLNALNTVLRLKVVS